MTQSRSADVSAGCTFIVDGKSYKFVEAQLLTDAQLVNAIVIDKFGYYSRKGLQDVSDKHIFRHDTSLDSVDPNYTISESDLEVVKALNTEKKRDKIKRFFGV